MNSLSSDKSKAVNTIVFHEKGKIIMNYKKISVGFNKYFTNLTKSLKKRTSRKSSKKSSIKKIIVKFGKLETIKSLLKNNATVFKDISMRIIKNGTHIYSHRLTITFNNCINNRKFPEILKYADVTPVFKKRRHNC